MATGQRRRARLRGGRSAGVGDLQRVDEREVAVRRAGELELQEIGVPQGDRLVDPDAVLGTGSRRSRAAGMSGNAEVSSPGRTVTPAGDEDGQDAGDGGRAEQVARIRGSRPRA